MVAPPEVTTEVTPVTELVPRFRLPVIAIEPSLEILSDERPAISVAWVDRVDPCALTVVANEETVVSTYPLLAASAVAVGVARFVIF